eukprot:gene11853-5182_t
MIGSLEEVKEIINLKYKQLNILNVYLFGSRLYNCYNKDSDFDVILITNSKKISTSTNSIETEKYNINIYHIDYFKFLIQENVIWALMCCWIPQEFIWKETIPINQFIFIDKRKLSNYTILDISHCYNKAKKLFQNDEKHVGLKNLVHCFREVLFSLEILIKGKIGNFEIANDHFMKIMNEKNKNFQFFEQNFYPQLHELMTKLKNFKTISEKEESLFLKDYLLKYDICNLSRDFSILVSKLENYFYVGLIDDSLVNMKIPIVKQCKYGIIYDSNYDIISKCVSQNDQKSFKSVNVFEKFDGVNTLMFWHNKKWNLIFKDQFKSKFYRKLATNKIQDNYFVDEKIIHVDLLKEEFWKIFKLKKYQLPSKEYSYNFEFCLKNLKTCQYDSNEIILIGVFSNKSNSFQNFQEIGKSMKFDLPKKIDLKESKIPTKLFELDPLKQEGFVTVNDVFEYQFHKSFQFQTLKKLEKWNSYDDNTIIRLLFDFVRSWENSEFLKYSPWKDNHLSSLYHTTKERYSKIVKFLDKITSPLLKLEKEELTIECKKYPFYYIIFEKIKSNQSYNEVLRIQTQKRFQKILKELEIFQKN